MGQYNCKINKKPNKTNKPTTLRPSDFANSHLAGWTNSYSKCQREPRTDSILQGLSRHRIFRQIQPFTQQRRISVQLSPWQVCDGGRATWRLQSKPSSFSEVARTGREMGQRLLTPAQKQEGKHEWQVTVNTLHVYMKYPQKGNIHFFLLQWHFEFLTAKHMKTIYWIQIHVIWYHIQQYLFFSAFNTLHSSIIFSVNKLQGFFLSKLTLLHTGHTSLDLYWPWSKSTTKESFRCL